MPIRVEVPVGFNISAPHMHATGLEALDLQPGDRWAARPVCRPWPSWLRAAVSPCPAPHAPPLTCCRVLDVGCGCGLVTAAAAHIVGRSGRVVGIDVKRECVELCERNVRQLRRVNQE